MIIVITIILVVIAYKVASGESPGTIANYARNAGFSGTDLALAVAIAYAESGGDPNAVGDLSLGVSIGLWQVNLAAHPEYTKEQLLDPQFNASAAYAIYQDAGYSFSPWTTYRTGRYQQFLNQAPSVLDQNETVDIGS